MDCRMRFCSIASARQVGPAMDAIGLRHIPLSFLGLCVLVFSGRPGFRDFACAADLLRRDAAQPKQEELAQRDRSAGRNEKTERMIRSAARGGDDPAATRRIAGPGE